MNIKEKGRHSAFIAGRRERGAGSGERAPGAGSGERGAGSRERGAGGRERGAGRRGRERGAGSGERGAGSGERGAGSRERGAGRQLNSNLPPVSALFLWRYKRECPVIIMKEDHPIPWFGRGSGKCQSHCTN
jgi:hypothetical protein